MAKFKISQKGYILRSSGRLDEIESVTYGDYLAEFGSDETTTGRGIAPRLHVDGNSIMSWGVRGNNHHFYASFKNKREATAKLYEIWEGNLEEECDVPYFAKTLNEMYVYLAESFQKEVQVIRRYFRLQKYLIESSKGAKAKHDNRPSFTKEMMVDFINSNREMIQTSLIELNELKQAENKAEWQVKANALIQKVSKNDFRVLNWKEIYSLIKETV